jgi:predicted nucleic acid-binding protein
MPKRNSVLIDTNTLIASAYAKDVDYRDAELDFTDAAIMALAERYAITEIATFDRRDFALVTPAHAEHFTLLP